MSGYEEEHNISRTKAPDSTARRPDLSTFFSTLDLIDTSGSSNQTQNNAHADPIPANVSSAYRQLANTYQIILGETEGVVPPDGNHHEARDNPLLDSLIHILMESANDPPRKPIGMPESFFDELERVPKNKLKETDICPICSYPFLDDKFPLVVQLPCHRDHVFDLDCIRPWLKLNTSCPLDRKDLQQNNESSEAQPPDEDEDDYDEMFA